MYRTEQNIHRKFAYLNSHDSHSSKSDVPRNVIFYLWWSCFHQTWSAQVLVDEITKWWMFSCLVNNEFTRDVQINSAKFNQRKLKNGCICVTQHKQKSNTFAFSCQACFLLSTIGMGGKYASLFFLLCLILSGNSNLRFVSSVGKKRELPFQVLDAYFTNEPNLVQDNKKMQSQRKTRSFHI